MIFIKLICFVGVVKTGISGGIGGMASWCLVFPADVVKSRIQIDSSSSAGKQSFISALNKIVKTEGKFIFDSTKNSPKQAQ